MRDLNDDLEICSRATPGPWYREKTYANFNGFSLECLIGTTSLYATGNNIYAHPKGGSYPSDDANFIAAAREGWPEAIERALKAELELHDAYTLADNFAADLAKHKRALEKVCKIYAGSPEYWLQQAEQEG